MLAQVGTLEVGHYNEALVARPGHLPRPPGSILRFIVDIKIVTRNGRNLSRSLLEREGEMGPWGLVARWHALRVRSHPDWVLALSPSAHSPLLPESADRKYRLKGGSQVA